MKSVSCVSANGKKKALPWLTIFQNPLFDGRGRRGAAGQRHQTRRGLVAADVHRVVAPNLDAAGIVDEKRRWNEHRAEEDIELSISNSRQWKGDERKRFNSTGFLVPESCCCCCCLQGVSGSPGAAVSDTG